MSSFKLIVPETIMTDIVSTIEPLEFNGKMLTPSFGFGNKDELTRFLDLFKDKVYPLIWMIPNEESHSFNQVEETVDFIIAVNFSKENKNELNNIRFEKVFIPLLIPLAEKMLFRIARSKNASYDNTNFKVFKRPNYHETNTDKPNSIHYWDALTLSLKMSFYNNCKS